MTAGAFGARRHALVEPDSELTGAASGIIAENRKRGGEAAEATLQRGRNAPERPDSEARRARRTPPRAKRAPVTNCPMRPAFSVFLHPHDTMRRNEDASFECLTRYHVG